MRGNEGYRITAASQLPALRHSTSGVLRNETIRRKTPVCAVCFDGLRSKDVQSIADGDIRTSRPVLPLLIRNSSTIPR